MSKTIVQNRIVGHEEVSPDQLLANPRNFRVHTEAQKVVLAGTLETIGYVEEVLVNRTTGHIVNGHLRVVDALARGQPTVPVAYIEVSLEDEKVLLLTLDPLAALAREDDDVLAALSAEAQSDSDDVNEFIADRDPSGDGKAARVRELDLGKLQDRFWVHVTGPLGDQMATLEEIRAQLAALPGVEVEVGTTEGA